MRINFMLLTLVLSLFTASMTVGAWAADEQAAALTVSVIKPAEQQWAETVPASGWLRPWHEAVIASEIGGLRITDVLVDVGSNVTKGQPLVKLAQDTVLAELQKQVAAVETAKANLEKATTNADRARKLQSTGAISQESITETLNTEATAKASLDSENAALQSAQIKLNQTTITAVDEGVITARTAQLGAVVASGTELFRLVRQSRIEWQAEISARYFAQVHEGQTGVINGPDNRRIEGTVRLVGPVISTDTGRLVVYVALPSSEHPPSGIYATGQIELQTSKAMTVPDTALVFRDGINYVFTVGPDHKVTRVRVEIGRRLGNDVEIVSGLAADVEVVKSGGAFLSDNALVRIEAQQ